MTVLWEPQLDKDAAHWAGVAEQLNRDCFAPLAAEIDREQRLPMGEPPRNRPVRATGLLIPREYGGQGASLATGVAVMAELTRACASTGAIWAAYALGGAPIIEFGTDEQKQFYLAEIKGRRLRSSALTERGAGSDPAAITSTGTREEDGWRLRGEKIFVGNGGASQHYVAFVVTDPELGARGISAFMTGLDDPGTAVTKYADRMGLRGARTSNLQLDSHVPADRMIGERGRGLRIALSALNSGRVIIAAQGIGLATAAFEHAATEASRRRAFGRPIIENQAISFRLADVATQLSAARLLTWEAAQADPDVRGPVTLPLWPSSMPPTLRGRQSTSRCRSTAATATASRTQLNGSIATSESWLSMRAAPRFSGLASAAPFTRRLLQASLSR